MTAFTAQDVTNLLDDLKLYSGNIRKITGLHGPHTPDGHFGGVIHTWMDAFNFSAYPMFSDDDSWSIDLPDSVGSLQRGHRSIVFFSFPKLHLDPHLQERYRIANILYKAYNGYSNVTEDSRLSHYERLLGYHRLRSFGRVIEAIVRDFRSHQEKKLEKQRSEYARN